MHWFVIYGTSYLFQDVKTKIVGKKDSCQLACKDVIHLTKHLYFKLPQSNSKV